MEAKVAIVTGASSGIGKATAMRLIADGYHVVGLARRTDKLQSLKTQFNEQFVAMTADVTSVADIEQVVSQTIEEFGRIDVLINNAGVGMMAAIEHARLEDWHSMMNVNVNGLLTCLHTCLPHLIQSKGHIVNMASVAAHDVFPNGVVYCASKHAVNAITVGFRKEFRDRVKITNISPGAVATEFAENTQDPEIKEAFNKNFEGIVISAEDIANAVSHILHLPKHIVVNEYIIRPNK